MTEVDLVAASAANSDQIEAGDFLTGPRIVTVTGVTRGSTEQPVNIHVAEFDRAYRPCKSMIRALRAAWGDQAQEYIGRRMQLYRDPTVTFGSAAVGGVRISAVSHITEPVVVQLMVKRGRRAPWTLQPLVESKSDILRAEWKTATPERRAEIEAEVKALEA